MVGLLAASVSSSSCSTLCLLLASGATRVCERVCEIFPKDDNNNKDNNNNSEMFFGWLTFMFIFKVFHLLWCFIHLETIWGETARGWMNRRRWLLDEWFLPCFWCSLVGCLVRWLLYGMWLHKFSSACKLFKQRIITSFCLSSSLTFASSLLVLMDPLG